MIKLANRNSSSVSQCIKTGSFMTEICLLRFSVPNTHDRAENGQCSCYLVDFACSRGSAAEKNDTLEVNFQNGIFETLNFKSIVGLI